MREIGQRKYLCIKNLRRKSIIGTSEYKNYSIQLLNQTQELIMNVNKID